MSTQRTKIPVAMMFTTLLTVSIGSAAVAAADPVAGGGSADAVIDRLTDEGYNVEINWVGGKSTAPLTECTVSAVHNPDRSSPPAPTSSVTVYVDVSCPNESDDSGIIFGPGGTFGIG